MQAVFEQLNERRETLLGLIVGDYIHTASPVASQHLLKHPELAVSPATIRNDMALLEELGFIARPHTSAGGIPQDSAYRFYVERIAFKSRTHRPFQVLVQEVLHRDNADPEAWARDASGILSQEVHNVSIATAPRAFQARLRHVQLVPVRAQQVLLVLVMQESRVREQRVQLPELFDVEELTALSYMLNESLSNQTAASIRLIAESQVPGRELTRSIMHEIAHLMSLEEEQEVERHYVHGLGHMLNQPEFVTGSRAREAVELVEDSSVIKQMTSNVADQNDVSVIIGNENRQADLSQYSLVLGTYGAPGHIKGTVAVMGPTRMDYARAISSVRYLTKVLSSLLNALSESHR